MDGQGALVAVGDGALVAVGDGATIRGVTAPPIAEPNAPSDTRSRT